MVAIATPSGRGGIGCVRISGPDAVEISGRLFRPTGAPTSRPGTTCFGRFVGADGRVVDHGYRVLFAPEASFSGEPTAELWAHGSPAVLAELVAAALASGATAASPGEFTYRALRHGRIDLSRAEAVRDLIAARTVYQARLAFAQVEGAVSRRVAPLRDALLDLIARVEAAVEFADEAETHLAGGQIEVAIGSARTACAELLAGFEAGRMVREGATVVLVGPPNVGKSSLFNRLLGRERAIVAAVPGTTRDTLEEGFEIDGIPVRLVDTAGLREEANEVEREGVRRARVARGEADLVLHVLGADRPDGGQDERGKDADPERTIEVLNKIDLLEGETPPSGHSGAIPVSAKTGEGIDDLRSLLGRRLRGAGPVEDPIVTNARHARCLEAASAALRRAAEARAAGFTEEVILEDLRDAAEQVGAITGTITTEDVYDRIFSTFCIGK